MESKIGSLELIWGNMFSGKCLAKDTPILLFDGSIKKVQDITNFDILMGDNFEPRKVLSVNKGYGRLFEVTQTRGMTYIINEHHILSLKNTYSYDEYNNIGKVVNIPLTEYLQVNSNTPFKKYYKGYRYEGEDRKIVFSDLEICYKQEGDYLC